jgi:hypothetical protein
MRRLAILVVVLGLGVPAGSAHAAFPGSNGKIAFQRTADIYTVNPDGSGLTNLTGFDFNASDGGARWNADASKIAFVSRRNGGYYQIYTMNNDGSGVSQVTPTPALAASRGHPMGRRSCSARAVALAPARMRTYL